MPEYENAPSIRFEFASRGGVPLCHCLKKHSGELVAQLDSILSECKFPPENGIIIWLDYTEPAKIGEQIREFQSLLERVRIGDVIRVTVNAHPYAFLDQVTADGKPLPMEERRGMQFDRLRQRIGDFLPSWARSDHMTRDDLPVVLSEAFAAAALKALPVSGLNTFTPLSIIRYADRQQMLSITGTVVNRGDEAAVFARLDLQSWPFASADWKTIHRLVVPHLTVRERLFLERGVVSKSPDD